ncbi:hypothetical protein F4558_002850 [Micromonospora profundi]|uniref:hypothetical protein n=1 Tax=Micromonospora profundi TaxID=1420889 RepID=UPI00143BA2B3|nr:hypothetical protein [Micromonospora profundi]NJC13024.1 hypothetical protein [Micromonospora profundi]
MNDRDAGAPNSRPGAPEPKSPMTRWDDDAAGHEALSEIERRLDQTWDVEAGLQEILLADRYGRTIKVQPGTFDVEKGLADIVGPPADRWDGWVRRADYGAADDVDIVVADGGIGQAKVFTEPVDAAYQLHLVTQSFNSASTVHRIELLADTMEDALLELEEQCDRGSIFRYVQAISSGHISVKNLQRLARRIEDRMVTRDHAVRVVDGARSACLWIQRELSEPGERDLPLPTVEISVDRLSSLTREAADLRVAVARLFDPSDDLVDMLQ